MNMIALVGLNVLLATGWPAFNPANRLDAVLLGWSDRINNIQSLHIRNLVRTDNDQTSASRNVWKGEFRYLKPNHFAVRLASESDRSSYELMIMYDTKLFEYQPQFKKVVVFDFQLSNRNSLDWILTGMVSGDFGLASWLFDLHPKPARSLREALARLKQNNEIVLAKDIGPKNPHYVYLDITPKTKPLQRDYNRAQIVLTKDYLPRRLWFERPNGSEVTWDLRDADTTVALKPADFMPPEPAKDWETVRVPAGIVAGVLNGVSPSVKHADP